MTIGQFMKREKGTYCLFFSVICVLHDQHFVAFQWKVPVHNLEGWLSVCPRLGNWFMRDFQNMVSSLCKCSYHILMHFLQNGFQLVCELITSI